MDKLDQSSFSYLIENLDIDALVDLYLTDKTAREFLDSPLMLRKLAIRLELEGEFESFSN